MGRKVLNLPQEEVKKTKAQRRKEAKAAMEELRKDILRHLDAADSDIMDAMYIAEDLGDELRDIDGVSAWFDGIDIDSDLTAYRDELLEIQSRLQKSKIVIDFWD